MPDLVHLPLADTVNLGKFIYFSQDYFTYFQMWKVLKPLLRAK